MSDKMNLISTKEILDNLKVETKTSKIKGLMDWKLDFYLVQNEEIIILQNSLSKYTIFLYGASIDDLKDFDFLSFIIKSSLITNGFSEKLIELMFQDEIINYSITEFNEFSLVDDKIIFLTKKIPLFEYDILQRDLTNVYNNMNYHNKELSFKPIEKLYDLLYELSVVVK